MTAPDQLVDPQQAAFWAKDPNVLHAPDYLELPETSEPEQTHRTRLALEIAAAFLVCARLVRGKLATQHTPNDPDAAQKAWDDVAPVFANLSTTALIQGLRMDRATAAMSVAELATLSKGYARGLATYLGTSSVAAYAKAVDRQLAAKWSEPVTYARAAAGFGLDSQAYATYLGKAAAMVDQEIVTPAAQALADAALLVRAELIGDTEAHTAIESAKVLHWQQMQAAGLLPATAQRRWVTHHLDRDCTICGALDRQQVELSEPFTVKDAEIWAPQAHPNCHCGLELVDPAPVAKAYNPNERRGQPGNRGQWVASPKAAPRPTAVAEPVRNPLEGLEVAPEALFTEEQLFTEEPLFTAGAGTGLELQGDNSSEGLKLGGDGLKLGGGLKLGASGLQLGPGDTPKRRQHLINTHILVLPPPPMPKVGYPYFMPTNMYMAETNPHAYGATLPRFSEANFDAAHPTSRGVLHARTTASPWDVLSYGDRTFGRVETVDGIPAATPREIAEWWADFVPLANSGFTRAIQGAGSRWGEKGYVDRLDASDRWAIADMAGYEDFDQSDVDNDLIAKIKDAVADMGTGNNSLASAYGDYMVYKRRDLLGGIGDRIEEGLAAAPDGVNIDLDDKDVDQVLTFQRGFHRGTVVNPRSATPRGKYTVSEYIYHSALAEFEDSAPPLAVNLQEAVVQPAQVSRVNPLDAYRRKPLELE